MKKIDRLVLKAFIGPFIVTFFIALFVLVMQMLWKYIDDLVGKGLDFMVILELIFYWTTTLVPMALPIAVLLSAIMAFGNMGEHYELVAIKAAGISLLRFMAPLIIVALFLSGVAFTFANYVLPKATLNARVLLYSINRQKPAFNIEEGVFYDGIEGFTMKVGRKSQTNNMIYDVLVYDHRKAGGANNSTVLLADSGKMYTAKEGELLIFKFFHGKQYEETIPKLKEKEPSHRLMRTYFDEYEMIFDLASFNFQKFDESLFKNSRKIMNLKRLDASIDSFQRQVANRPNLMAKQLIPFISILIDSSYQKGMREVEYDPDTLITTYQDSLFIAGKNIDDPASLSRIFTRSVNSANNAKTFIGSADNHVKNLKNKIIKYEVEYHYKLALSLACLVLFFIGAPLGAIIRKGGFGMPMVIAIIFFIIWHILSEIGRKLSQEGAVAPELGMWMSTLILLPLGIFLSYKAMTDSALMNTDAYINFFKAIINKFKIGKKGK